MLKTPQDYAYDKLVDSLSRQDYRIATNDAIIYRVFTNNGYKLLDFTSTNVGTVRADVDVVVESDGFVKMPLLGSVFVKGLTIKEAEKMMEERYSKFYVDPFVNLRVNNRRAIVFPGSGGTARVITLNNNNTSVLEVLASAGGIVEDGKAYKVKLIRNNPEPGKKPLVYLMDLSRISGIGDGQSIVQAGDIIYVEPRYKPLATLTKEVAPILTLTTTFLILYQITKLIR